MRLFSLLVLFLLAVVLGALLGSPFAVVAVVAAALVLTVVGRILFG